MTTTTAASTPTRQFQILDGAFWAREPHAELAWLRENDPVHFDEAGQVWAITKYADVLAVSREPELFRNDGGIRPDAPSFPFMINLNDPLHRKRRGLVNKGFTVRRVQEREPRIRQICIDLLDKVRGRDEFDFVMDLAAWLPLIVIGDMLGVEPERYDDVLRWSDDMVRGSGTKDPQVFATSEAAFSEFLEHAYAVLSARRGCPMQSDLFSILANAEIDGERLEDAEIVAESLLILIGGDETTRHVITGGMYELLRQPQAWQALQNDPSKIPAAVEEMLRWVTPIKNMARTVARDTELRGRTLREGDKLVLLYPSANRDADVFESPDRFDIARSPNEHLAFGFGAHYCLGASLARLELNVFFQEAVRRLAGIELASEEPPPRRQSNFISGIEHMPVRWR
ncbi:MAG TPA: cytochrome P450 [Candidatus Limnocylindrales bacterium]|nr:cytochrome P450 [Candidatus Limnocylindrales bacterium]